MTDFYTAVLLPIKPLSDDDSGFRNGFGAKPILPLPHNALAVTHITTRLCGIDVTLWDRHILSWIYFMYVLLSDRESQRLVKNTEVELVMKPQHPTSRGNILVIQPFLTHCSCRSSYFSNLC